MPASRRLRKNAKNTKQVQESDPAGQSDEVEEENIPRRTRSRSRSAGANKENPLKRRRTELPAAVPEREAKIVKTIDGKVIDIFCWLCHKLDCEISCEVCPRVYHADCLKKLRNKCCLDVGCECQLKSVDGRNEGMKWDPLLLKRMLQYVMDRAIKPNPKNKSSYALKIKFSQYFHTWLAESEKLCKIMDIAILIDNMNGEEPYLSTNQFYMDVKWLYHNCFIFYGVDNDFTDLAKKFENNIRLELTDLELCDECYRSKVSDQHADSFARVCSNPHELIWAKLRGSPYWPAKCLDIRNGHAEVRFFGTHDRASVMVKNCFKISHSHPYKRIIQKAQYMDAMREVSVYLSNYKTIHGDYIFHDLNTPLDEQSGRRNSRNVQKEVVQTSTFTRRPPTMVPETIDNKTSRPLCVVNNFNENGYVPDGYMEYVSENGVMYASEFTAEHENNEAMGEFSENFVLQQNSLNPAMTLPTLVAPVHSIANSVTVMDGNSARAANVASSSSQGSLPVITSTHSNSPQLAENSIPVIASTSSENVDYTSQVISALTEKMQSMVAEEEAEEEIQIVSEKAKTHSILKNSILLKAVAEILLAAKPNVKNLLRQIQDKLIYSFISMYVDANLKAHDSHDLNAIVELCDKYVKKLQVLEKEKSHLEEQNKKLQDHVKQLEEDKQQYGMGGQKLLKSLQVQEAIIERAAIRLKRENYDAVRFEKYQKTEKLLTQENQSLREQLATAQSKLKLREGDCKFFKDQLNDLKAQLNKVNIKNEMLKSTAVQTDPESSPREFQGQQSPASSPNTSDDETSESTTFTQTIECRQVVYRRETQYQPFLSAGVSEMQQTFGESESMPSFPSTMQTVPLSFMPTPAPPLFTTVSQNYIPSPVPPSLLPISQESLPNRDHPLILDAEHSTAYLDAVVPEACSSNSPQGPKKIRKKRKNNS